MFGFFGTIFLLPSLRSGAELVYYSKTVSYYSNMTTGLGDSLLENLTESVSYTIVSELLGTNGTYGFQLTMTPTVTVSVSEAQLDPLNFSISVRGTGSPLSNGVVKYCLIMVDAEEYYPTYSLSYGTASLDNLGSVFLNFPAINGSSRSFVLFAYAYLPGLVGMSYYKQVTDNTNYIIPLVSNIENGEIILAHSRDIDDESDPTPLTYNATFLTVSEDLVFASNSLQNSIGLIDPADPEKPYGALTISKDTSGILAVTYKKSDATTGVSLIPWGIGPLSFPITFGESPAGKEWVSTSMRQVVIDKVGYQAVLSLWSLEGYEMIGQ